MSWKLFGQIVLLMVIGALILSGLKYGMMGYKKHHPGKMQMQQEPTGRRR